MSRSTTNRALGRFVLALAVGLAAAGAPAAEVWRKPFTQAFTAASGDNKITGLAELKGEIYLSTARTPPNSSGPGGKIWRLTAAGCKQWADVTPTWSSPGDQAAALIPFQGQVYAGTESGRVWRTAGGQAWSEVTGSMPVGGRILALAEFKGQLYLSNFTTIWRSSNGISWTPVVGPPPAQHPAGFGTPKANDISALAVFQGQLYAGLGRDNNNGIQIWRTADGAHWELFHQIVPEGDFGGLLPGHVHAMRSFGSHLYVGKYHGNEVYRTDGAGASSPTHWETSAPLGATGNILRLAEHNGKLYAAISFIFLPGQTGPLLYATQSGNAWSPVPGGPSGGPSLMIATGLLSHAGKLLVGTYNPAPSGTLELWELDSGVLPDPFDQTPPANNTAKTAAKLQLPPTALQPSASLPDLSFHDAQDVDFFEVAFPASPASPERVSVTACEEYCGQVDLKFFDAQSNPLPAKALMTGGGLPAGCTLVVDSGVLAAGKLLVRAANPVPQTPIRYCLSIVAVYPQVKSFQRPEVANKPPFFNPPITAKTLPEKGTPVEEGKLAGIPQVPAPVPGALGGGGVSAERGLHGYVRALDAKGERITGAVVDAKIEFFDQAGKSAATVTSNSLGYYRVNLAPGVYYYKVTRDGFRPEDVRRGVQARLTVGYDTYSFSLTPGKDEVEEKSPPVAPVPLAALTGEVWERTAEGRLKALPPEVAPMIVLTRRGAKAAQADPAGAESVQDAPSKMRLTVSAQAQTGGRGFHHPYQVSLAAGSWQATVAARGFQVLKPAELIAINAGQSSRRDFELVRLTPPPKPEGQGIKGNIVVEGGRRPGADALSELEMRIIPKRGRPRAPKPAADPQGSGAWAYSQDLDPGTYRVEARLKGYQPFTSGSRAVYRGKYSTIDVVLVPRREEKPPESPPEKPEAKPQELVVTVVEASGGQRPGAGRPTLGVTLRTDLPDAVEIEQVSPDTPAAAANLLPGDRIEAVDNTPVRSVDDLIARISGAQPGQALTLTIRRGGNLYQAKATLAGGATQGRPVENAAVEISAPAQSGRAAVRGTTDSQGKVRLKVAAEGPCQASASKANYLPGVASVVVAHGTNEVTIALQREPETAPTPPTPPTAPLTPEPGNLARLVVEVVEKGSLKPFNGPEVVLLRGGQRYRSAETGDGNRCVFLGVPYGSYQVVAFGGPAHDPVPQTVKVSQPAVAFRLELTTPQIEQQPTRPGPIPPEPPDRPAPESPSRNAASMWVRVVGPSGEAVSSVQVILGLGEDRRVAGPAFSDANGYVHFPRVEVGPSENPFRYWLRAYSSGRMQAEKEVLPQPWWIARQVVLLRLEGLPVTPESPPTTQPPGTLPGLPVPPGKRPVPPGGRPTPPGERPMPPGGASQDQIARVRIEVRQMQRGVLPIPVPGAWVTVGRTERGQTTDDQGQIRLSLPSGNHLVRVVHRDFEPANQTIQVRAQAWPGGVPRPSLHEQVFTITLTRRGAQPTEPASPGQKPDVRMARVRIDVVEMQRGIARIPVGGATVTIPGAGAPQTTDAQGQVRAQLAPGNYRVHVTHGDFHPADQTIQVQPGTTRPMFQEQSVTVTLTRRSSPPSEPGPDRPGPGRPVRPGRPGVEGGRPGGLFPGGTRPGRPSVPETQPEPARQATLNVEVRGAHGNRPAVTQAAVTVSGGGIAGERSLRNLGNGRYAVELPAGQYRVRAKAPGYHEATVQASVALEQNNSVQVSLRSAIE